MLETLSRLTFTFSHALGALMQFMVDAHKITEELAGRFFKGLLQFLEDAQRWIHSTFDAIKEYLVHFLPALVGFVLALFKLSLFYVPTILTLTFYFYADVSVQWVVAGLLWFLLITGIGLTYGKRY